MSEDGYHHGDLKKEMIEKGLQLLNQEGYGGFSLRKVAAACRVSHAAPYRHFKSKDELIQAITGEIAAKFQSAFAEAIRGSGDSPRARLSALCCEYVRFMAENPDYFRYIFTTVHERPIVVTADDMLLEGADHPFSIGREYAKAYFGGLHRSGGWMPAFLALWSQIHGYTLLLVNRTIDFRGDYLDFARHMVADFLDAAEAAE
jgi:AcrR family transcriptional regulator